MESYTLWLARREHVRFEKVGAFFVVGRQHTEQVANR